MDIPPSGVVRASGGGTPPWDSGSPVVVMSAASVECAVVLCAALVCAVAVSGTSWR